MFKAFLSTICYCCGWDGLTSLVLLASVIVAVFALRSSRKTAQQKHSIELMCNTMGDANFHQAMRTLAKLHNADDIDIKKFADEAHLESDEVRHVRHVLNFFEHISIGIKHGIYHEGIVKETICNVLLDAWEMALPYVKARRESKRLPTLYQEVESLVSNWRQTPLKKNNRP